MKNPYRTLPSPLQPLEIMGTTEKVHRIWLNNTTNVNGEEEPNKQPACFVMTPHIRQESYTENHTKEEQRQPNVLTAPPNGTGPRSLNAHNDAMANQSRPTALEIDKLSPLNPYISPPKYESIDSPHLITYLPMDKLAKAHVKTHFTTPPIIPLCHCIDSSTENQSRLSIQTTHSLQRVLYVQARDSLVTMSISF